MISNKRKKIFLTGFLLTVVILAGSFNFVLGQSETSPATPTTPTTPTTPAAATAPAKPLAKTEAPSSGSGTSVIGGIASRAIATVISSIGYVAGFVSGILFTIGGWLITFGLTLNKMLLESPMVMAGWEITRNITNLGFVLAIIIISFATIFRLESYGMKKVLWKLIVAALIVNFSLVIAGAFLDISQNLTDFLLEKTALNPIQFSKAVAGLFHAQALLKFKQGVGASGGSEVAGLISQTFSSMLPIIASVFFIAFFNLFGAITMLAIAIMLLIRYVTLGILLVLSPIVWLLWIFPSTSGHFQTWWKQFIRWTFFPPLMLFFVYLAVLTIQKYPDNLNQAITSAGEANLVLGFGVDVIADMVLSIGLLVGGLFAANKLGITFADTAYGWAKSSGKAFGGWAGRWGKRGGTALLRGEKGKAFMGKVSSLGAGKRGLHTLFLPIRKVGGALEKLATKGGEALVAEASKTLPLDDAATGRIFWALPTPARVAALIKMLGNKTEDLIGGVPDKETGKKPGPGIREVIAKTNMDKDFIRFGQPAPTWTNVTRSVGMDKATISAAAEAAKFMQDNHSELIDDLRDVDGQIRELNKNLKDGLDNQGKKIDDQGRRVIEGTIKTLHAQSSTLRENITDTLAAEAPDKAEKLRGAVYNLDKNTRPAHWSAAQLDEIFQRPDFSKAETDFGTTPLEQFYIQRVGHAPGILEANPDSLPNIVRGIKGINLDEFLEGFMGNIHKQAKAKGMNDWEFLNSDPKYKKIVTAFKGSGFRNVGLTVEGMPSEEGRGRGRGGATLPGYRSDRYD